MNLHLNMVTAVILIDNDSNRVLSKFYQPAHPDPKNPNAFKHPFQTLKEQRAFEAAIWEKTRRQNGDILLYENQLVLYKQSIDLTFYIVGPAGENELMLQGVLTGFYDDAVAMLLRHQVEKRSILENLDLVVLALDETIDNGRHRIPRLPAQTPTQASNLADIQLNEQSIMQAFTTVRDKIGQRILQG
ncbi:Golgi-to-ER vesicle coat component [Rhodotorula toruloides]